MDPYTGWITLNTHLDAEETDEHVLKVHISFVLLLINQQFFMNFNGCIIIKHRYIVS